jgi:D-3-phosphoglycerate dehydrogenase
MSQNLSLGHVLSTSPSFGQRTKEPLELLESFGHSVQLLARDDIRQIPEILRTAVAWVVGFEKVNEETLADSPNLRVVAKCGAGLDNFDLPYLASRNITVVSVPGGNARAVAEYTMSQVLALARGTISNDKTMRSGVWGPNVGKGLDGRTMGIIGFGAIGRMLVSMAQAFGLNVIVTDPLVSIEEVTDLGGHLVPLEDLLVSADFVSLHVPLTPITARMINRETLLTLKPGSFLINNSRGGVVDETAVGEMLHSGHLAGAALDVFEHEPLKNDSPLLKAPNLILSSHTSGYSDTTLALVTLTCARLVAEALTASSR